MGAPKQKWTSEEEEALRAGVAKHGTGKWKNIQKDPEFGHCLAARSNIDLKDKWRNMSVSLNGQGSREKIRPPKLKALPAPSPSTFPTPSFTQVKENAPADPPLNSSNAETERKPYRVVTCVAMIYEALTTIKDPNGSDVGAILNCIKQKHDVPPDFRRNLSSKLRKLVSQNKLEKVQNCFKLKKDIVFGTKTPTAKQKDSRPKQSQSTGFIYETLEEAAVTAAYKIAEAENKSFVASEAVKEAERVSKMAEDSDTVLQLAKQIVEQCMRGEIVMMA